MDVRVVGERVKELREKRGWSQGLLAQKTGLKQGHISMIEAQKRINLRADVVAKLAEAFGVTVEDLMRRA